MDDHEAQIHVVAYANRLPVTHGSQGWRASAGGLASALRPALEGRGTWIGWDGGSHDVPDRVEGLDIGLRPVSLSRRDIDDYYYGFANRTLWPLLHGLVEPPVYDNRWWHAYREVNDRFASVEVGETRECFRWVHDYQLMLVPTLLRGRNPTGGPIGFFLHVPFPPPEIFTRLPWRQQIINGLLGADVISFHTRAYRDNFVRSCLHLRSDVKVEGEMLALPGRSIRTAVHPISIDAKTLAAEASKVSRGTFLRSLRKQFEGKRVLLGVDRLDYTKGIVERLQAIELLLERRADLRRDIAFVQIAVPSRGEIREYSDLRYSVEQLVGRINGRFTAAGHDIPVHYLYRNLVNEQLLAYYSLADVCLVTPLADGMNLVAKEFVVAQNETNGSGALVISEFAGSAVELKEALPCNPFDIADLSGMIELALDLDQEDRRSRIEQMAATVRKHDVFSWLDQELATAASATKHLRQTKKGGRHRTEKPVRPLQHAARDGAQKR